MATKSEVTLKYIEIVGETPSEEMTIAELNSAINEKLEANKKIAEEEAKEAEKTALAEQQEKELEIKHLEYIDVFGQEPGKLSFDEMDTAILEKLESDKELEESVEKEKAEKLKLEAQKAKKEAIPEHIQKSAKKYFEQYKDEKEVCVSGDGNFFKPKKRSECIDHAMKNCNGKYFIVKK